MSGIPEGLEPALVWKRFSEILEIPRPSGHEERIAGYITSFAEELGLPFKRDECGDVLVTKEGTGAGAGRSPIMLQAHTDMVAEKRAGVEHDFLSDPVRVEVNGDLLVAPDTTMGADNGIGVALMLAVLESTDLTHPPLECLFTVDEERGLVGAARFPVDWISSRRLMNLDSETEGAFCIGCAGGMDITLKSSLTRARNSGKTCYRLTVDGLLGGHSGIEIGLDRACALRLMGRLLDVLSAKGDLRIAELRGGTKRNAIPREATALVFLDSADPGEVSDAVLAAGEDFVREYDGTEEGISIHLERVESPVLPLDTGSSRLITDMLLGLPHGVQKMDAMVDGLVETSVNFATAYLSEDSIEFILSVRSSIQSARDALIDRISAMARIAGFSAECSDGYPGWAPDHGSKLLSVCRDVYRMVSGRDAEVEIIHAGLECGLIGSRIDGMDMISAGPDIRDVHVPGESVSISSLARFWKFLTVFLESLE